MGNLNKKSHKHQCSKAITVDIQLNKGTEISEKFIFCTKLKNMLNRVIPLYAKHLFAIACSL